MMEKYGAGPIVVSDYDPNWPMLFEQERIKIREALGSFSLSIEHMGSTAVPGLPSKPIIDALLVFRDYLRAHPEAAQAYADVKRALAASSIDDIEAYRTGKNIFVEETTAKARAWRARMPPGSG